MQRPLFLLLILLFSCKQNNNEDKTKLDLSQKDTGTKLVWRKEVFDPKLKANLSKIVLNEQYFQNISEPEKAAIGYVATFVGSECDWDEKVNKNFTNLNCKVISALGLGYQCSDTHLNFLKRWFRDDPKVLSELKDCSVIPFTATEQNTFDSLNITEKEDTIKILYEASGVNLNEGKNWNWSEEVLFRISNDKLILVNKSKVSKDI